MNGIIDIGTMGPGDVSMRPPAVLVLGATGAIGRGVVQAALDAGRAVLAVDRDAQALVALHAQHSDADLHLLAAAVDSDEGAASLAARVRALGVNVDGIVANIAGTHRSGRLIDQPADVLRRALDEDLMPHLFAARHLLPLLSNEASSGGYVLVGGAGGNYPWAGYGHCSIAAAALRMMARVLHDEAARAGLRVQLLSLQEPLTTKDLASPAGAACPGAVAIGRRALALLSAGRGIATAAVIDLPGTCASASSRALPSNRHTPSATSRELRDARALLASVATRPPTSPGILHDENF